MLIVAKIFSKEIENEQSQTKITKSGCKESRIQFGNKSTDTSLAQQSLFQSLLFSYPPSRSCIYSHHQPWLKHSISTS